MNSHITKTSNPFLSKDSVASGSIFKSKESFSDIYSGKEWDFDYLSKPELTPKVSQPDVLKSQDNIIVPELYRSVDWEAVMATAEALAKDSVSSLPPPSPKPAPFSDAFKSSDWSIMPGAISEDIDFSPDMLEDALLPEPALVEKQKTAAFQSRDWILTELLGRHEDVSLSPDMFRLDSVSVETPLKTDWAAVFQSQIAPPTTALAPAAQVSAPKKKRKRKKRKKVVLENKAYVKISEFDVLLGRGGRSNHHPGNKRYREEVENFRRVYGTLKTDSEKTEMSQLLVAAIQKTGGRFLEEDKEAGKSLGWYVVPNIVARRKASQALREDNDPEKRKAKRARYLAKKKAAEGL